MGVRVGQVLGLAGTRYEVLLQVLSMHYTREVINISLQVWTVKQKNSKVKQVCNTIILFPSMAPLEQRVLYKPSPNCGSINLCL